jgi:hypothetical protein
MQAQAQFALRQNPDGSLDSICLSCDATAATATTGEALRELEKKHVCYDWNTQERLAARMKFSA